MEEELEIPKEANAYLLDSIQSNVYKYDVDEDFEEPKRLRDLTRLLDTQTENDTTILRINHFGGSLFVLLAVVNSIQGSKGRVVAEVIHGSSAGSLLALACDDCFTVKFGEWFIHEQQSANYGDLSYRASQIDFSIKTQRHLFDELYSGFLTEAEIEDLCSGKIREYNFDYIEANERLVKWREYKESLVDTKMEEDVVSDIIKETENKEGDK